MAQRSSVHRPQHTGGTQQVGTVASVLVTQVALANALETGPTGPSLTQGSHSAVPQAAAGLYFSQH